MSDQPTQGIDPSAAAETSISDDTISILLRGRTLSPPNRPGPQGNLDRFEILRVLGEGGMGLVLLARDPAAGSQVAIKLLKPALVSDQRAVQRFCVEAAHMQGLDHAHILRVLEVATGPTGPYVVLPYMPRGSLSKLVHAGGSVDAQTAIRIAIQVAGALAFAHKRGIIHRDLKPANILLDDRGDAHLADFGLGRTLLLNEASINVHRPSLEGTPAYMAPEVAEGEAGDFRRDIYAFGSVLYELLTGRPPYLGSTVEATIQMVRSGPPKAILDVNPKASRGLARIAQWAMARELRDRYAQVADVVADLERVNAGQEPLGPHGQAVRSRRSVVLAVGLAAATLACALYVYKSRPGPQIPPPELRQYKQTGAGVIMACAADGRALWVAKVDGVIAETGFQPIELEPGQPQGLVVGIKSGADGGKVRLYNADGQMLWEKQTAEDYPYTGESTKQMVVTRVLVDDLWPSAGPFIVVVSNDYVWYPSKISIYTRSGELKRVYWHPGHLDGIGTFKPSAGNCHRILAWGCNNGLRQSDPGPQNITWCRILVCLDPETMAGEAPPRNSPLGKGREAWYVKMWPEDAAVKEVNIEPPIAGGSKGQFGQLLRLTGPEQLREHVYLNENGEYIRSVSGTGSPVLHTERVAVDSATQIPCPPSPQTGAEPTSQPK